MIKSFKEYPSYFYTGFFIRLFAFIVDLIMITSLQKMVLFSMQEGTLHTFLSLIIYLAYFILMTKFNNGQTIGKMIFGIKVICLNEEELSWKTVIVREGFGRYLQKTIVILYALIIFTPYKQHLVDILSDTSVVTLNFLRVLEDEETRESKGITDPLIVQ